MPDLSVIIVNYNTKQLLFDCLKSLHKAIKPAKGLEIIVVDNASHDGSVSMVHQSFPSVLTIKNRRNYGFAKANNLGVKKSSGKYLLFLNSDTLVDPHSLVKPLKYLKTHPQAGALTVKLILGNGKIDPDNHRGFPTPWTAFTHFTFLNRLFPQSHLFNNYYQSYKDFSKIHRLDVAAGSYLLLSRKLFTQLGGWDESYFFYGEDIDLCYRIHQAGYHIIYYPKVKVIHLKGASSGLRQETAHLAKPPKANRLKVAKESVKAMKIFYKKFYAQKYPKFLTSFILLGITLRGQLRIIKHHLLP